MPRFHSQFSRLVLSLKPTNGFGSARDHLRVEVRQHGQLVLAADRRHDGADRAVRERRPSGRRPAHAVTPRGASSDTPPTTSPSSRSMNSHGDARAGPGKPRVPPRTATRPPPGRPATASAAPISSGRIRPSCRAPHARVFTPSGAQSVRWCVTTRHSGRIAPLNARWGGDEPPDSLVR